MSVKIPDNYFVKLNDFGLLEVTGDDAGSFLQSQLTSDVSILAPGDTQFSSWCNPQGRIITTLMIHAANHGYLLLLPVNLIDEFKRKISMYILRSRVSISSWNESEKLIGTYGRDLVPNLKNTISQNELTKDSPIITIPDTPEVRCVFTATADFEQTIFTQLDNVPTYSINTYWQYQDIDTGIVWVTDQTTGKLLPQDINLEKLDALSFKKGCFPGQEIIARLHYRGKEKYGLYKGIIMDDNISLQPGDKLYLDRETNNIGIITSAVMFDDGKSYCLASLNHIHSQQSSFNIENKHNVSIRFSEP